MVSILEYIEDLELEVKLSGEITKGEYGEDGGEAWGFKYLSTMQEFDQVEEITFDKTLYDEEISMKIGKYIEDNFERLEKNLIFEFNR